MKGIEEPVKITIKKNILICILACMAPIFVQASILEGSKLKPLEPELPAVKTVVIEEPKIPEPKTPESQTPEAQTTVEKPQINNYQPENVQEKQREDSKIIGGNKGTYMSIIEKSFKTIESDSWKDARANLDEVIRYFAREKGAYGVQKNLVETYYQLALALRKFSDGGFELDERKEPDYEKARSLYIEARNIANRISPLPDDPANREVSDMVKVFNTYIDKEIQYIDETVGQ